MRKSSLFVAATFVIGLGIAAAKQNVAQEKPKDTQAAGPEYKISKEDIDKKNPVKPSEEGLAAARRIFTYDCAMCHGAHGDGKGDLVESMKLTVRDWRDPTSLTDKTDGELFYIIAKGKGKMMAEGDRAPETMCWNLVNLVRSFAKKETAQKPPSTNP